jgi:large subunit ribosomal protein L18e
MVKRTGPTNVYLKQLVETLKKQSYEKNAAIWRTVAEKLEKPRRQKVEINLSDIERLSEKDEIILVPGTVLGDGDLSKPISIAAWRFSPSAEEKIKKAKGKIMSIEELMKDKPDGSGVRILV